MAMTNPLSGSASYCPACGSFGADDAGNCRDCGVCPTPDRAEIDLGAVAGVTDRGTHHVRNEDGLALRYHRDQKWAVLIACDGVSASDDGDIAARQAAAVGADSFVERLLAGDRPSSATTAGVAAAAVAVARLANGRVDDRAPACTFVSAIITHESVTLGWVGDSRAYWLSPAPDPADAQITTALSQCLTEDDSWAGQMVAAGLLDYEAAAADPRAHVLTAWLGADADHVVPHVRTLIPPSPGVVVVCTDGLWNYLDCAEILAQHALPAALTDPLDAARTLTGRALEAGGYDNITVAVAPFPPSHPIG